MFGRNQRIAMSINSTRRAIRNSILYALAAAASAQADTWTQPPASPTGDANLKTIYTSSTSTKVGIGFTAPASGIASPLKSALDVKGNAAIGLGYAGITAAPANGLIVEGNTGIGFNVPQDKLHVAGVIAFHGVGLDGSTYQRAALYADATNQFLVEAPKKADGTRLNMIFNWRGGGTPALFVKGLNSFVGLGTNDPKELLDVRGNATLTGSFQAASIGMVGAGLDGSTYQRAVIYTNSTEGLVFEAPKKADGTRLNINLNWRGQGVASPLFVNGTTNTAGIFFNNPQSTLHVGGEFSMHGAGLNGTGNQRLTMFATANEGFGIEVPKKPDGSLTNIAINWRGGGQSPPLFINGGNRYLGINTATPQHMLHVAGSIGFHGGNLDGSTYQRAVFYGDDQYGLLMEAPKIAANGTVPEKKFNIELTWRGGGNPALFARGSDGFVGIGTKAPVEKLEVAGNVKINGYLAVNDVKCKTWQIAPDYVFAKEYDLRKLDEVEKFIAEKKHLPEIPSAKEIAKDGLNLAEMNLLLLKKVEELTLYAIEQNKRIAKLESDRSR